MSTQCVGTVSIPNVPVFGCVVTGPRDEALKVWSHTQGHTVSQVTCKDGLLCPCLNIPQDAKAQEKSFNET